MPPVLSQQRSHGTVRSSRRRRRTRLCGFERLENRSLLATFTVNSLLDTVDAIPGDGVAQDASGQTSLRAAIMEANARAGDDTIVLPAGTYALTLTGANEDGARTGDLDVLQGGQLTITGAGAGVTIIDAEGLTDRVLHAHAGATVRVAGVAIRNGNTSGQSPGASGGGILNSGALTINNSTVTGNTAATGGGIHNNVGGTLTITDSTISGNGRNAAARGGGIYNSGALTLINCTIATNSASNFFGQGGGIFNSESGTATIASSTIRDNGTTTSFGTPGGGGIYNLGSLTVTNTTISENSARAALPPPSVNETGSGGGLYNQSGTVSLTNSTVSGNLAPGAAGIFNDGEMVIRSSTISSNRAGGGLFGVGTPGGIRNWETGRVTLQNTIVAGNLLRSAGNPDFLGVAASLGHNLIGDARNNNGPNEGWIASDTINVDARLGPLADNGGPTMTHALLPDSPAIDAGNNAGRPSTDQRGNRRPRDGNGDGIAVADIGAFELSLDQSRVEAVHDTATVNEDTTGNVINVLANDTGPSGSMLSVVAVTQPASGSTTIGPNGAHVHYTPSANFTGTDTFGYTVSDGMGAAATAMVTVTVVNVDTDLQGTAGDDVFLVRRDATGANLQVFANDTATGTPIFSAPLSSTSSLLFEALGGDDRLIIELANGSPLPTGGIQYLGGDHGMAGDSLIVNDSGIANGTYVADTTAAGNGTVTIGGRNIILTGVEPINVSGLGSFTVITPNAADTLSVSSPSVGMSRFGGTSGSVALSPVTFTNMATFIIDAATHDGAAGNDSLTVDVHGTVPGGFGFLQYRSGIGTNTLTLNSGTARIDSTVDAGGTLNTTVSDGAHLVTHRFRQTSLTVDSGGRATILPDGTDAATSVLNSLTISTGGTLDINDNALIVDYTGNSPVATIRTRILSGRGGVGVGQGKWTGTGITSSTAQQANATEADSRSVGYSENALLPLGPYTTFRGQPVDNTSVLIAYTRTADANLDGLVNDDDVTIVGATYAPGVPQLHWALGDFDYNGFVDDDDVTLLGVLYNPSAAPLTESSKAQLLPTGNMRQLAEDVRGELFSLLDELEGALDEDTESENLAAWSSQARSRHRAT